MDNPRILIVTPNYHGKDYSLMKHLGSIKKLDYDNYTHIMIDNSPDSELWFFRKLKRLGIRAFRVARGGNSRIALNNAMNFARDYMIEHKYDYMLVVESDLFPRPDTIKRLLSYGKSIIGSFYLIGHAEDDEIYDQNTRMLREGRIDYNTWLVLSKGLQPRRACIFELDRKKNGVLGTRNIGVDKTVEYYNNGLKQVHGTGLGCTLIRNDIIMRFPFWTDSRFGNKHHDVYFYMDLHNAGVKVWVDTDVMIEHQPSKWSLVEDM